MSVMSQLFNGFAMCLTPENLVACLVGVLVGTLTGVLPGLGPIAAMSLLLPLTFGLGPTAALIMFAGIYYGAMYGGSTTSVLMNIPGEGASVITCLDGYQMAKKGRAGAALAVAAIGSFVAGTVGIIGLMLFAPALARVALIFGPPEYFGIAFLGLIILCNLTGKSMIKALIMVFAGIMVGTIGMDSMTSFQRFTMNFDDLQKGIDFAVLAMGTFGVGEVLEVISQPSENYEVMKVKFKDLYPTRKEIKKSAMPIVRGSFIGFLVGLLPGPASVISTFVSYAAEKKISKHPEEFGHGAIEGVAGPESANNSATSAALIPLMALGLPFSPATALLLTGLMIHGITPGPTFITQNSEVFWGVIASMYIGNVLLLIFNLPMVGVFASLLRVPLAILMPIIIVIVLIGAFTLNNTIFDLWLVIIFGIVGYIMRLANFEPAPLVVGMVLGPTMEKGIRQGLMICDGSFVELLSRPIVGIFVACGLLLLVLRLIKILRDARKGKQGEGQLIG
jgi:putative tricarboxylic transport membrane protein